jgi:hypothetical protein
MRLEVLFLILQFKSVEMEIRIKLTRFFNRNMTFSEIGNNKNILGGTFESLRQSNIYVRFFDECIYQVSKCLKLINTITAL